MEWVAGIVVLAGSGALATGRDGSDELGASARPRLPFIGTAGAIAALPTSALPQIGQFSSPRARWSS